MPYQRKTDIHMLLCIESTENDAKLHFAVEGFVKGRSGSAKCWSVLQASATIISIYEESIQLRILIFKGTHPKLPPSSRLTFSTICQNPQIIPGFYQAW